MYAVSFFLRSLDSVSSLNPPIYPIQFREQGTTNQQANELIAFDESTTLGSNEKISIMKTHDSPASFSRTMVSDVNIDDQRHHYVFNFTGNKYNIYKDGVLQTTNTESSSNTQLVTAKNLIIGTRKFTNNVLGNTSKA